MHASLWPPLPTFAGFRPCARQSDELKESQKKNKNKSFVSWKTCQWLSSILGKPLTSKSYLINYIYLQKMRRRSNNKPACRQSHRGRCGFTALCSTQTVSLVTNWQPSGLGLQCGLLLIWLWLSLSDPQCPSVKHRASCTGPKEWFFWLNEIKSTKLLLPVRSQCSIN